MAARRAGAPTERVRTPARALRLQVLQSNEREGGPHGDAEGEPRNQSRNPLAIHLLSPPHGKGPGLLVLGYPGPLLVRCLFEEDLCRMLVAGFLVSPF
jgi:hypothetical protein